MTFAGRPATDATDAVRTARDFLLSHPHDYDTVVRDFAWPKLTEFNFALEWFDVVAGEHPDRSAVTIVDDETGHVQSWSYGDLARRSDQVATWLTGLGLRAGDKMVVMLNNTIELWEILMALMKVNAVAIPTSTLLNDEDLAWRVETADARFAIAPATLAERFHLVRPDTTLIAVGGDVDGWLRWGDSLGAPDRFTPVGPTPADSTSLLYFTSGTTARPKLVRHTQVSYPVGHLSTMYWLGVRPGDVHLNISSPGWGKHAWSNFFSPFLAQATVFIVNYDRFHAERLLRIMDTHQVSSFCAPPTVWRMLIQADLSHLTRPPRELVGAGEALNPEVINKVRAAWGNTIRDGYGQTEMTCAVGNSPGQPVTIGAMGRPLPGYKVVLLDTHTDQLVEGPGEGEICLDLSHDHAGLMGGYFEAPELTAEACRDGYYHTGDIGERDEDGYITYVGRADDVFKASDYKISPFELESALMLHEAVVECAVVPSPDDVRGAVPKAYVLVGAGHRAGPELAASVFAHCREHLNGYQLVRILEFVEALPKTISAKIRRVELRAAEAERVASGNVEGQFFYRDFR